VLAGVMDREDALVIESGQKLRFALEARQGMASRTDCASHDLHGEIAVEFGIVRAVHDPHASSTDLLGEEVPTETLWRTRGNRSGQQPDRVQLLDAAPLVLEFGVQIGVLCEKFLLGRRIASAQACHVVLENLKGEFVPGALVLNASRVSHER